MSPNAGNSISRMHFATGKGDPKSARSRLQGFMAPTVASNAAQKPRVMPTVAPPVKQQTERKASASSMAVAKASGWVASATARIKVRTASIEKKMLKKRQFLKRRYQTTSARIASNDSLPRLSKSPPRSPQSRRASIRNRKRSSVVSISIKASPELSNKRLPLAPNDKPLPRAPTPTDSIHRQSRTLLDASGSPLRRRSDLDRNTTEDWPALFHSKSSKHIPVGLGISDALSGGLGRNNPFNPANTARTSQSFTDQAGGCVNHANSQELPTVDASIGSDLVIADAQVVAHCTRLDRSSVVPETQSAGEIVIPRRRGVTRPNSASKLPQRRVSSYRPGDITRNSSGTGPATAKKSTIPQAARSPTRQSPKKRSPAVSLKRPRQTRTSILRAELHTPAKKNLNPNPVDYLKSKNITRNNNELKPLNGTGSVRRQGRTDHPDAHTRLMQPDRTNPVEPHSSSRISGASMASHKSSAEGYPAVPAFDAYASSFSGEHEERSMSEKRKQKLRTSDQQDSDTTRRLSRLSYDTANSPTVDGNTSNVVVLNSKVALKNDAVDPGAVGLGRDSMEQSPSHPRFRTRRASTDLDHSAAKISHFTKRLVELESKEASRLAASKSSCASYGALSSQEQAQVKHHHAEHAASVSCCDMSNFSSRPLSANPLAPVLRVHNSAQRLLLGDDDAEKGNMRVTDTVSKSLGEKDMHRLPRAQDIWQVATKVASRSRSNSVGSILPLSRNRSLSTHSMLTGPKTQHVPRPTTSHGDMPPWETRLLHPTFKREPERNSEQTDINEVAIDTPCAPHNACSGHDRVPSGAWLGSSYKDKAEQSWKQEPTHGKHQDGVHAAIAGAKPTNVHAGLLTAGRSRDQIRSIDRNLSETAEWLMGKNALKVNAQSYPKKLPDDPFVDKPVRAPSYPSLDIAGSMPPPSTETFTKDAKIESLAAKYGSLPKQSAVAMSTLPKSTNKHREVLTATPSLNMNHESKVEHFKEQRRNEYEVGPSLELVRTEKKSTRSSEITHDRTSSPKTDSYAAPTLSSVSKRQSSLSPAPDLTVGKNAKNAQMFKLRRGMKAIAPEDFRVTRQLSVRQHDVAPSSQSTKQPQKSSTVDKALDQGRRVGEDDKTAVSLERSYFSPVSPTKGSSGMIKSMRGMFKRGQSDLVATSPSATKNLRSKASLGTSVTGKKKWMGAGGSGAPIMSRSSPLPGVKTSTTMQQANAVAPDVRGTAGAETLLEYPERDIERVALRGATQIVNETIDLGIDGKLPRRFVELAKTLGETIEQANQTGIHLQRAQLEFKQAIVDQSLCMHRIGLLSQELQALRGDFALEGRHSF